MQVFIFSCANFLDLRNTHHQGDQHTESDKHGPYAFKVRIVVGYVQYPVAADSHSHNDERNWTQYEYAHHTGQKATQYLKQSQQHCLNNSMATAICKPRTVTQSTGSAQVNWTLTGSPQEADDLNGCGTQTPLTAVHGIGQLFDTQNTGVLTWSGYANPAVSGTLTGISIRVYSDKRARCLDNLIQLTKDGVAVGNNLALATAGNDHTYSAAVPTGITLSNISTLGVQTQYKSGSKPHRDNMTVDTVHLIVTYT